jgi:pimeloyl-ACP methyl ester carboxylesterase
MSGALATLFGARHPTAAVVNVDQPPQIREFAGLLRQLEPQLRGSAFNEIWHQVFAASFHTELLPAPARDLVAANSRPVQGVVLSYWSTVLERPVEEIQSEIDAALVEIGRRAIPYVLVMGRESPEIERQQMEHRIATLRLVTRPQAGHFPHLADPAAFAALLTEVAEQADERADRRAGVN